MSPFRRILAVATVIAAGLLAACSETRTDAAETLPVDELYAAANTSMNTGNYARATRFYTRLIARFPFGRYTEQAELELAYSQYRNNDYEEALSTTNRFIRTYPTHPRVDYAHYLRGLINFDREVGLLERYIQSDATRRDLGFARQSFQDFGELLQRFPESPYAADARQRMVHLRNELAQAELNIAQFYFRREAFIAAQSRAQYIVENYQQTPQIGDALAILTESYRRIGEDALSEQTRQVLQMNFPDHPYLTGSWPARGNRWWQLIPIIGEDRAS
jgi:outer membrane protein assembly factor BamD